MALSNMTVVSDGNLEFVSISFNYLDRSEISVYFDSVPNNTWAWVGDTNQIQFTPKVPNGVTVLVARTTDASDLRHTFSEGAAFTARTLDEDLRQVLHIVQEAKETNLAGNFYDDIDMNNNKITNLAPGSDPSDAVTFQQLQDLSPDAGLRAELAKDYSNTGSGIVGFRKDSIGAVGRSVESKLRDTISVRDFGAVGDGVTNDQTAIVAAVLAAVTEGLSLYWPAGTYLINANLLNFWGVVHTGPGVIQRGSDVFYITPQGDEQNIIYVGSPNLNDNDGLTRDLATNIGHAVSRMRSIGAKAQGGRWRIQMFGSITSNGVTLQDMPIFRNRLEIFGEAADNVSAVPTTVWDGTSAAQAYAIRGDWSNNSANLFLHFRNIKFTNWNKSTLAGGIVIWCSGDVLSENIHADTCAIGEWYRQCYARTVGGRADNCQTYGIQISYGASGNVGNLSGGGKVFTNCGACISVGRQSTVYIEGCDLSGDTLIDLTRNSRIRTRGNTYRAWTKCVVDARLNGVWTDDNSSGAPDSYLQTPSYSTPVMLCSGGSVHQQIQRFSGNMNAVNTGGSLATVSGTTEETLLSSVAGTPGDFVPSRLPSWWAYSPTAALTVDILLVLATGAGGTLELRGAGASSVLASINIPAIPGSGQSGWIKIQFMTRKGSSTGRYVCEFKSASGIKISIGPTTSLNSAAVRAASEDLLLYRLYWTPENTNTATFADMRSYVDV